MTQSEALRLADEIDCDVEPCDCLDRRAASELRFLHAANMDNMAYFNALMSDYTALERAAQQALEAMDTNQYAVANTAPHADVMAYNDAAIALREALEKT